MDMDKLDSLERNNVVLTKTLTYVNGEIKEVVKRQIKSNLLQLNNLLDDFEREHSAIQSYEQGGPNGN